MSREQPGEGPVDPLSFPAPDTDNPVAKCEWLGDEDGPESPEHVRAARYVRELYLRFRMAAQLRAGKPWSYDFLEKRYPSLDGGVSAYGRKYKPVWPELVRVIQRSGLTPFQYLAAHFHGIRKVPEPRMLLQEYASVKAQEFVAAKSREIAQSWKANTEVFRTACRHAFCQERKESRRIWQFVLLDHGQDLSALFRVCLGAAENFPAVVSAFLRAARREYCPWAELYDSAPGWSEAIPAVVRQGVPDGRD